jgi:hypothetical protein
MIKRYQSKDGEVVEVDTTTSMINGERFKKIRDDLYKSKRDDTQISYNLYGDKLVREVKKIDNLLIQISVDEFFNI